MSVAVGGYLLLCIILGGSAQGVWGNLALQIIGIGFLVAAALFRRNGQAEEVHTALWALLALTLVIAIAQLVPLPATVWMQLPGRGPLSEGLSLLGYAEPSLPISYTPYASVMCLFAAIPAIAMFVAVVILAPEPWCIALAVVVGAVLGILLGALQVGGGPHSWAYLYHFTNPGEVGFFANENHMATLLLVAMPMAAAMVTSQKSPRRSVAGRYGILAALLVLLLVGIALNGSLAALTLVIPLLFASASLLPTGAAWRRLLLPLSGLALIGAVVVLAINPVGDTGLQAEASGSLDSRVEIWRETGHAIADTFPVGTGLGSFEQIYRQYENPNEVTLQYVNHAHNDYLEIILELGLAGALIIGLFLTWWIIAAASIWKPPLSSRYARAASIATAAILAHSVVDFPLRTAAVSAIFAACVGLMAGHLRPAFAPTKGELRAPKHSRIV